MEIVRPLIPTVLVERDGETDDIGLAVCLETLSVIHSSDDTVHYPLQKELAVLEERYVLLYVPNRMCGRLRVTFYID